MICILDKGVFKLRTVCHYCNQYYYPNFFHLFKKNLFIFVYLFLAALGLCCGARASHCGGFSCCGARALGAWASVVAVCGLQQLWLAGSRAQAQQLRRTGLVALRHVELSIMSKKELLPRHHWIVFSRGQIELNPARNRNLCRQRQA